MVVDSSRSSMLTRRTNVGRCRRPIHPGAVQHDMFAERGATLGFKRVGVSGLFYSEARMSVWFLLYGAMVLGLKQQVLLRVGHCHVTVPVLKDTQTAIVQL